MIRVVINGKACTAEKGESLLSVARRKGIDIPAFCYEETLAPYGACRMCLVEVVKGAQEGITTACTLAAAEGLEVLTQTSEIVSLRRALIELYLAQAPRSEAIRALAQRYGIQKTRFARKVRPDDPLQNRCILCGLCVRICHDVMGAGAINYIGRGHFTEINTPFYEESAVCMGCGACARVCPTQAIAFEDIVQTRTMKSWSGTRVPLHACSKCGRHFAPAPFVNYARQKLAPDLQQTPLRLCPDCRSREIARKAVLLSTGAAVAD